MPLIGRFAFYSIGQDTPVISNKKNGFSYTAGENIVLVYDGYKGASKVKLRIFKAPDLSTDIYNQDLKSTEQLLNILTHQSAPPSDIER